MGGSPGGGVATAILAAAAAAGVGRVGGGAAAAAAGAAAARTAATGTLAVTGKTLSNCNESWFLGEVFQQRIKHQQILVMYSSAVCQNEEERSCGYYLTVLQLALFKNTILRMYPWFFSISSSCELTIINAQLQSQVTTSPGNTITTGKYGFNIRNISQRSRDSKS